uniref:Trigger factor ribosome-binding bacterial domain-containing protein n=1 Tax=Salix viminalis TaxID=40686 RepID=A0A6N2KD59_SALVM
MAAMTTTASTLQLQHLQNLSFYKCLSLTNSSSSSSNRISFFQSHFTRNKQLLFSSNANLRVLKDVGVKPISAVGSGMEASIAETSEKLIALKNVKIVIESQEEDKMQVRVDLSEDETQKVFNKALTNLARSAPPIPGFRREKGGKTTKVSYFHSVFFLSGNQNFMMKLVLACMFNYKFIPPE